jgi:magnesium-transporting ATPase (P-type)
MLWVNIIMDTLGALAFACEPARVEYMKSPPKPRDEKIISRQMVKQILSTSLYVLCLCVWFLKGKTLPTLLAQADKAYILSAFFAMFIFVGVFVCFTSRSTRVNILSQLSKNKAFILIMLLISVMQMAFIYFGGELFRAVPLEGNDLITIILISMTVIAFDLIRKLTSRLYTSKKTNRRKINVKQISTRG